MPRYEFRCRACGDTFEVSRPMADSARPALCPQGHGDTVKLLSTVAMGGRAAAPAGGPGYGGRAASGGPAASGGGCCGGACGC